MRGNAPDRTSNNRALKNIDDRERMWLVIDVLGIWKFEEIRIHAVVPRDFYDFWLLNPSGVSDIGK